MAPTPRETQTAKLAQLIYDNGVLTPNNAAALAVRLYDAGVRVIERPTGSDLLERAMDAIVDEQLEKTT